MARLRGDLEEELLEGRGLEVHLRHAASGPETCRHKVQAFAVNFGPAFFLLTMLSDD